MFFIPLLLAFNSFTWGFISLLKTSWWTRCMKLTSTRCTINTANINLRAKLSTPHMLTNCFMRSILGWQSPPLCWKTVWHTNWSAHLMRVSPQLFLMKLPSFSFLLVACPNLNAFIFIKKIIFCIFCIHKNRMLTL